MNNRAGEMEVFVRAAELGSFSAAARQLDLTPSAASKVITRIEDRLGTRLFVRSTRALQLTPEGETYLARAQRILADIEEAERLIAHGSAAPPQGPLRVNASVPFGISCLLPLVPDFLAAFPGIRLDLSLTDGLVDLIEERADVAIRVGPLRDSTLKALKLCESRRVVVAAPGYLRRHGTPQSPDDLLRHNCLTFNFRRSLDAWPFRGEGKGAVRLLTVDGNLAANNGATVRQLCLDGLGVARLGRFHVEADLASGRLVPLLEELNPGDTEMIHALFAGHDHLPTRVRAFVDFLAARLPPLFGDGQDGRGR
jgi:DNA-binding transcriptional LysR family regulator